MHNFESLKVQSLERYRKLFLYLKENNDFWKKYFINFDEDTDMYPAYQKLPYIDKSILKCYDCVSKNSGEYELYTEYTSGSTGMPLNCYKTAEERNLLALKLWRERKKYDPQVTPKNFCELLGNKANPKVDFINMEESNIINIFEWINQLNPRWLCLSPTMAYNYAKIAEKNSIPLKSVKFFELQGEAIDDDCRKYIEDVFNIKTVLQYGMRECWTIAYECRYGHLHLIDNIIFEILDNGLGKENYGELVVSTSDLLYMPILKYKTGDYVSISYVEKCKCKKTNSYVLQISGGRSANLITGYNLVGDIVFKRIIRDGLTYYVFNDVIHDYNIVQEDNSIHFYMNIGEKYNKKIENYIQYYSKRVLGEDVEIDFIYTKNKMNTKQVLNSRKIEIKDEKNREQLYIILKKGVVQYIVTTNFIFQIYVKQDKINSFHFFVVKGQHYTKKIENFIKERAFIELGNDINLKFSYVDNYVISKTGKSPFFIPFRN